MPIIFPPVTLAGRTLVDAGISCNLPLRALFSELPHGDVTCLCTPTGDYPGPDPRLPRGETASGRRYYHVEAGIEGQ